MSPEERAVLAKLLGEETSTRVEERPQPPKAGRDAICDICGYDEGRCKRTPIGVSGHTFVAKRWLAVDESYRSTTRLKPQPARPATPLPPPRPTPQEPAADAPQ